MNRLDRYIGKTVLQAMLVVLLVLAGLDFIFTLFEEIGDTGGGYRMADAFDFVLLTMPRHIYELLPMTALIGALTGLGILASNNELVVMQSAGVKVSRIVWAVMKPALMVMLAGLCLGQFIAPPLEMRAEVGKALASGEEVGLSRYGHWQREDNRYMHFNAIEPEGVLHGVTIYTFNGDHQPVSNTFAERAVYREEANGGYWMLEDVEETTFDYPNEMADEMADGSLDGRPEERSEERVLSSTTSYDSRLLEVDLTPDLLQVLVIDPDRMAISDLYRYATHFREQGQDASEYFLGFWKKLLQPLTTTVLVLVAVSFIFGPLRESTSGSRVFVAICFGLLFIILQRLLNTVSLVYNLDPLSAVLLPILLSALVGVYLLRRSV